MRGARSSSFIRLSKLLSIGMPTVWCTPTWSQRTYWLEWRQAGQYWLIDLWNSFRPERLVWFRYRAGHLEAARKRVIYPTNLIEATQVMQRTQVSGKTKNKEDNFFFLPSLVEQGSSNSDLESRSFKSSDGQNSTELDYFAIEKRMKRTFFGLSSLSFWNGSLLEVSRRRIPARSQSSSRRLRHQISLEPASHTLTNHRLLQESSGNQRKVTKGDERMKDWWQTRGRGIGITYTVVHIGHPNFHQNSNDSRYCMPRRIPRQRWCLSHLIIVTPRFIFLDFFRSVFSTLLFTIAIPTFMSTAAMVAIVCHVAYLVGGDFWVV